MPKRKFTEAEIIGAIHQKGGAGHGYTPIPGDDGLCVYQIKSYAISSLNETLTRTPPSAVFTAKAYIRWCLSLAFW